MGTIVLHVKKNNCKTPLPEAATKVILLQIYSRNGQQRILTPIKFAKQSYWSKAHHCAFIHRVARSEKQVSQRKQTLRNC